MLLQDLYTAYFVARANKRRSEDSVAFELHYERNLAKLSRDLEQRTFSPTAYTFIVPRPRPREVFACDMAQRIVHHYIHLRLGGIMESEMTDRSFNNRVGYGQGKAINTLLADIYAETRGFTREAWVIGADIRGYFPNAQQDIVYRQALHLLDRYAGEDKDLLHYMLMASIFSNPTQHCYRKSSPELWSEIPADKSLFTKPEGTGGAIGFLIWQNAMNYYLNDFDHYCIDTLGLRYIRFVDDMRWVVTNKECLLALMPTFRAMLAEYGCEMHPHKFYCQQARKGGNFIGAWFKGRRVYVGNRVVRNASKAVRKWNKRAVLRNVDKFLSSINSYLGLMKGRNAHRIAMHIVDEVSPRWLEFVHFNPSRVCFQANMPYKQRIQQTLNIKLI